MKVAVSSLPPPKFADEKLALILLDVDWEAQEDTSHERIDEGNVATCNQWGGSTTAD
ncbi:hypothetical protein COMA2_170118 [Candidatus Nitrospira nitrificans]|uniref:Uncharacterized protein n=1 Tax=Candidatus Nitrospira nitrificans TaxID=1742973 RepID=A0A0S4LDC7_9BACT|nr:hypothetical protein COMA2_170118 [Candidatus Nitrospira nitrificans]